MNRKNLKAREWYRTVYLRSDPWKAIRLEVVERHNGKCSVCRKEDASNDVHHIYYDDLRFSQPDQFSLLCRDCHTLVHERITPTACHTPLQQRAAVSEFYALRDVLRTNPLGLPMRKRINGMDHCESCLRVCGNRMKYDPWKKECPSEHGIPVCEDCLKAIHSRMCATRYSSGSDAWKAAKQVCFERRVLS